MNEPDDLYEPAHWTLVGQAVVALESTLLLEVTRRRAEWERLLADITAGG